VYLQLAVEPPSTVVFDFVLIAAQQIGWAMIGNAIYDGLKVLLRRGERTRFRFRIHTDGDEVVAEVQTSSEAGLKAAIKGLKDIDAQNGGLFVRESGRWRKAGTGKRARPGTQKHANNTKRPRKGKKAN
jgi:hypothetical protein